MWDFIHAGVVIVALFLVGNFADRGVHWIYPVLACAIGAIAAYRAGRGRS